MLSKTKKYNKSDKNTSDTQKIQKYLSGFDPKNAKIMKVIPLQINCHFFLRNKRT